MWIGAPFETSDIRAILWRSHGSRKSILLARVLFKRLKPGAQVLKRGKSRFGPTKCFFLYIVFVGEWHVSQTLAPFRLHADRNPRRFVHYKISFLLLGFYQSRSAAICMLFFLRFPIYFHHTLSTRQISSTYKEKFMCCQVKMWHRKIINLDFQNWSCRSCCKGIRVSTSCMTRKCLACGKAGHRLESWRVSVCKWTWTLLPHPTPP